MESPIALHEGPTPAGSPPADAVKRDVVSISQLEYFVAVAEEGHLTRAARRLHISQPPLSRQIRSLEDELGAKLFARTPRGMTLLPAGQELLVHARRALAALDAARRAVQDGAGVCKICNRGSMERSICTACAHADG
jgi:molybdenum-dependent DNA-binding transcriptional regulator ModE